MGVPVTLAPDHKHFIYFLTYSSHRLLISNLGGGFRSQPNILLWYRQQDVWVSDPGTNGQSPNDAVTMTEMRPRHSFILVSLKIRAETFLLKIIFF